MVGRLFLRPRQTSGCARSTPIGVPRRRLHVGVRHHRWDERPLLVVVQKSRFAGMIGTVNA
jgi:hypothetical protein